MDNRGFAEEDYGNEVLDMADYNQGYAINSLMIYDRLIQILEANQLGATLAPELCDSMALGALERSRKMVELADSLRSIKDIYWERFQSSQLYVDQDASVVPRGRRLFSWCFFPKRSCCKVSLSSHA